MKYCLFSLFLFLVPLFVSAETIPAGFPSEGVWLSKTNVTAGDSVTIYTAIYNSDNSALRGTLVFSVDGTSINSEQFELTAGQTKIESTDWKATSGSHSFSASIKDASGNETQAITISNTNSGSINISVAEPPPATGLEQTVSVITNVASQAVSASLPFVANVAKGVINATENFREAGIALAEKNISQESSPSGNEMGGGATSSLATEDGQEAGTPQEENTSLLSRAMLLASPGILFTFKSPFIFYLLLCAILLLGFYLIGRRVRRPRI